MESKFIEQHLPRRETWPCLEWFGDAAPRSPQAGNFASIVIERALERDGKDRIAIYDPAPRTYLELAERANKYSNRLRRLGVAEGDRVMLRAPNGFEAVAAWLGVLQVGAVVVTVLPTLRARELTAIIDAARIQFALCTPELAVDLELASNASQEALRGIVELNEGTLAQESKSFAGVPMGPEATALIAFTSGTTGKPKAAVHSHGQLMATCEAYGERTAGLVETDRVAALAPLAFTYGLGALVLFPLWARAASVIAPSPEGLLSLTQELGITTWFLTPSIYRVLPRFVSRFDVSSLKRCISAGEMLPASVSNDFHDQTGVRIADGLGTTEMLHIFVGGYPGAAEAGITGRPVPGYEVRVLNEDNLPTPPNTLGRLAVRGPTGCRYLGNEAAQQSYVLDGWNVTGDVVLADEQGRIHYHSRVDDLIIADGMNVAAAEVENLLLCHSGVQECAVVGVKEVVDGSQVVTAVVAPKQPNAVSKETLTDHLKADLATFKQPRRYVFVERLPRTPTGKVQRRHIRQLLEDGLSLASEK